MNTQLLQTSQIGSETGSTHEGVDIFAFVTRGALFSGSGFKYDDYGDDGNTLTMEICFAILLHNSQEMILIIT